jgi:hypothetical protein
MTQRSYDASLGSLETNSPSSVIKQTSIGSFLRTLECTVYMVCHRSYSQALHLSMAKPTPGEIFNIVDDDCSSRATAMAFAADILGLQLPAEQSGVSTPLQSRGEKRVLNQKAKSVLGWQPRFPSYKEGLHYVLECEQLRSR